MFYSDDTVRDVLNASDIYDIVSRYVTLKKSGRGYTGRCPFHNEKTPSFHISTDKQLYHCFGCGAGGSSLTFIMKMENLDFVEALKYLADRAGISLPEPEENPNAQKQQMQREQTYAANVIAAKFFNTTLTKSEEGKAGLEYFIKRGFTPKAITSFGLGFAPDSYDALIKHMKTHGYSESQLVDCGLAIIKNNRFLDKFRNRVVFPIIDVRNRVIGFSARVLDDGIPKYLNSPETAAFSKSKNLFGFNLAKNTAEDYFILVEGQMDVVLLHQFGLDNTIASLGTALTEDQVRLIGRYTKKVILCYDNDEAGIKATLRAIDLFSKSEIRIKVATLSDDSKDPDEFIKKHGGIDLFKECLNEAVPATRFRINLLKSKYNLNDIEDKIKFISEVANILISTNNPVEIDSYVNELAGECDIKKESIYAQIKNAGSKSYSPTQTERNIRRTYDNIVKDADTPADTGDEKDVKTKNEYSKRLLKAESLLISLIFSSLSAAKKLKSEMYIEDFSHALHKKLVTYCYEAWDSANAPDCPTILAKLNENEIKYASSVLCENSSYSNEDEALEDLLRTVAEEKIKIQISKEKDPAALQSLLARQASLKHKQGGFLHE